MTIVEWTIGMTLTACAAILAVGAFMSARGMRRAPLLEDDQKTPEKPVPAPEASAGPSAPLDNHGCYVEPERVRYLREAYAVRHRPMTAWEIAHAQEAWEGYKAARKANGVD